MPEIDYPLTEREIKTRVADLDRCIGNIDKNLQSDHWCTVPKDALVKLRAVHTEKKEHLLSQLPR